MRVGIREFKNRATQLVRGVETGGEDVTITRHNRPVAVLTRPLRNPEQNEEAVLDRLSAAGLLRRGDGKPFSRAPRPVRIGGKALSATVVEERERGH